MCGQFRDPQPTQPAQRTLRWLVRLLPRLKGHRSSREPPPRPTIMTSTLPEEPSSRTAEAICSAAPISCTGTGTIRMLRYGHLRCKIDNMSRIAAPDNDVTRPTRRGNSGNGRLRARSNNPSRASFSFNCPEQSEALQSPSTQDSRQQPGIPREAHRLSIVPAQ